MFKKLISSIKKRTLALTIKTDKRQLCCLIGRNGQWKNQETERYVHRYHLEVLTLERSRAFLGTPRAPRARLKKFDLVTLGRFCQPGLAFSPLGGTPDRYMAIYEYGTKSLNVDIAI